MDVTASRNTGSGGSAMHMRAAPWRMRAALSDGLGEGDSVMMARVLLRVRVMVMVTE